MSDISNLLDNNRLWSEKMIQEDPQFFDRLLTTQCPDYLWIGCSDSRIPANQVMGLMPGEVFVHRNIANVVVHTDLNCLSVIYYAVTVLKIKHIIVCGHYGCGGVIETIKNNENGLIDSWLQHIRDIYYTNQQELDNILDFHQRVDRLCELNVIEQVKHVCASVPVQQAWKKGADLSVHGWLYHLNNGLITDLKITQNKSNLKR